MKKRNIVLLSVFTLYFAFWMGTQMSGEKESHNAVSQEEKKILYYVDPMNPAHTSDSPGIAPCGMDMVPVYADGAGTASTLLNIPGLARISPEKQQLMGVRLAKTSLTDHDHSFRSLGRVAVIENNIHRITAGSTGWVWKVLESTTGSILKKHQLMATVYNYDFLLRQQQFLYALDFDERRKESEQKLQEKASKGEDTKEARKELKSRSLVDHLAQYSKVPTTPGGINPAGGVVFTIRDQLEVAELELYSLGVGKYQLEQIKKNRKISTDIEVRSPVDGIVLSRNISQQQRFDRGEVLFQVADVGTVWVYAEIYEADVANIQPGMEASVVLPSQGTDFKAKVTDTPPVYDPVKRSYMVQLEVKNNNFQLRPDMVVDVNFKHTYPSSIFIPVEAVVDSGQAKTVFVDRGNGNFEPRQVTLGANLGEMVEVKTGLLVDESYVSSGTFLVNSESRMKFAATAHVHGGHMGDNIDRVCGMEVDQEVARKKGLTAKLNDKTHYFCSPYCKETFERRNKISTPKMPVEITPEHSLHQPPVKPIDQAKTARDVICGMQVDIKDAKKAGLMHEHNGKMYYFCHESCKLSFKKAMAGKNEPHQSDDLDMSGMTMDDVEEMDHSNHNHQ